MPRSTSHVAELQGDFEESCLRLKGFVALLDRDVAIEGDTRDQIFALLRHLLDDHWRCLASLGKVRD